MTLRVDPNGYGSSKGTHVTVGVCLMKGANDNNLQFPMTGIFTVQVMNWMGDIQHFEQFIEFDDNTPVKYKERVVTGERAVGWGKHQFISHNELTSSNKQYLHEDKMCFKIIFYPFPQTGQHYSILTQCDLYCITCVINCMGGCGQTIYITVQYIIVGVA